MKLLIASDLHGSALCCRLLLDAFRREKADRLVLLGDLLYHGPRNELPEEYDTMAVTALLNSMAGQLFCVRGNCDTEVDQMVLKFPVLSDSAVIFADGHTFFLSHGHRFNPETLPPLKKGDVLINGHTHIPRAAVVDGIHCLNDGSAALPKENSPHTYMVYENGVFTIKDMDGNIFLVHDINNA